MLPNDRFARLSLSLAGAAAVAFTALSLARCTRTHGADPAAAQRTAAPVSELPAPAPAAPGANAAPPAPPDDTPSLEEKAEFERRVPK
jgi:hypothetical protein